MRPVKRLACAFAQSYRSLLFAWAFRAYGLFKIVLQVYTFTRIKWESFLESLRNAEIQSKKFCIFFFFFFFFYLVFLPEPYSIYPNKDGTKMLFIKYNLGEHTRFVHMQTSEHGVTIYLHL